MSHQGYACCCGNHTRIHWASCYFSFLHPLPQYRSDTFSLDLNSQQPRLHLCVSKVGRRMSQDLTGTFLVIGTNLLPASVHSVSDQAWESCPRFPIHSPHPSIHSHLTSQVHILPTQSRLPLSSSQMNWTSCSCRVYDGYLSPGLPHAPVSGSRMSQHSLVLLAKSIFLINEDTVPIFLVDRGA